jgi:hypothetical protein
MFQIDEVWRWFNNEDGGGGIVIAESEDEAREKLAQKYGLAGDKFIVWLWVKDIYFDKNTPDIFDIYG